MTAHDGAAMPARRRGRRPSSEDTRAALLDAARDLFIDRGYDGATVRLIAARAGVDPAMVNHWFGGKERLFAKAVLQVPFNPAEVVAELLAGDINGLGERIVRRFLTVWDATGGGEFTALVRIVTSHEQAIAALREFLVTNIFSRVTRKIGGNAPLLRADLVGSQLIGMGMARYVIKLETLAVADVETLVRAVGPNLQRYLTGDID